jgi:hypothetical protein
MTADPHVVAICWACDGIVLDHELHTVGSHEFHEDCCPTCAGRPISEGGVLAQEVPGWLELTIVLVGLLFVGVLITLPAVWG